MTIVLAPMEGLLDFTLRDILTRVGGIDRCVAEFIRVTNTLLPERSFIRVIPELQHGGCTPAGVPVRGQLLGSDPVCLAENAARLASLGPAGIDLNFGCPAKQVNRHGGGAALLQDPELIHRIVAAVRRAVPPAMPVSAKMRLGFRDESLTLECAHAMVNGGASELVVHARTQAHGYKPPAYWERIADIRRALPATPIIANGEIWTVADAQRCREYSTCHALMLGRGMVSDPGLARAIVAADSSAHAGYKQATTHSEHARGLEWAELQPLLAAFWRLICGHIDVPAQAGRLKQWLNYLRRSHHEAEIAYAAVRTINDPACVAKRLGLGEV
jgi:tRNA-dihydrouridine synthase C